MPSKSTVKHNGTSNNTSSNRTPSRTSPRPRSKRTTWKMENSKEIKIIEDVDNESVPLTDMDQKEFSLRRVLSASRHHTGSPTVPGIPNVVHCENDVDELNNKKNGYESQPETRTKQMRNGTSPESTSKRHAKLENQTGSNPADGVAVSNVKDVSILKTDVKCNGNLLTNNDVVRHIKVPSIGKSTSRKESLSVPGLAPVVPDTQLTETPAKPGRKDSTFSFGRESSKLSIDSSRRSVDIKYQYAAVQMPMEEKQTSSVFAQDDSWIRIAIPYLPLGLAVVCLVLNILIPGSGTMLSGLSIFCCAKSRVPPKYDQDILLIMCVNIWVGVAQLFTVTFLLVGWFWSLAWGIKMVIISVERRRELKEQRAKELQTLALSAFGSTLPAGRLASLS